MITDSNKSCIFLADTLKTKNPRFYTHFTGCIEVAGIQQNILNGTADIWAVDYMPVQITERKFVKYIFNPDYLKYKNCRHLLTDVNAVWKNLNFDAEEVNCDLVLDGGNIVYEKNKLICTEKIFRENPNKTPRQILELLEKCFDAGVIVIPVCPGDWTGHADGEVRFIDATTVLVNEPENIDDVYFKKLTAILKQHKLNYIESPCPINSHTKGAIGLYLNYLQVGKNVFVPTFDIKEDEEAVFFFEEYFKGYKIISLNSKAVAKRGGVLRCVSWGIRI